MLKKRLIGVVTVKDGWAVQSFGYRRYLPLGKVECLVENLNRWEADEILVQVIDRSVVNRGPDFDMLERLGSLGLNTPLIFGGGIRSVEDGIRVIQCGADRLTVDALLHDNLSEVRKLADRLGSQAVIASLPISKKKEGMEWRDYRLASSGALSDEVLEIVERGVVSEVLVIDWTNEGYPNSFDPRLVDEFPLDDVQLIAFGGLSASEQMARLLEHPHLAAVAVGNFLSYREHAIQKYKEALTGMPLRTSVYTSEFSLHVDA
jgi:imidazole glycerol-phosphate synthase subunit HisF